MARDLVLEVANLICRFGETLVLKDLLSEVVIPAFMSDEKRTIRETEYFFIDQKLEYLDESDELALCCRMVKNTELKRHQIYSKTEGVVTDERTIESAPTSIAVLLLKSHRLLFIREVPNAPNEQQFGTTFRYLLRNAVLRYRDSVFEQKQSQGEKITKKELRESLEIPSVKVIPIASEESLNAFLKRFSYLTTLKINVLSTNNTIDNEEFFESTRGAKDQVGSESTTLTHRHSKGLNKAGCATHIKAAQDGNLEVNMIGKDDKGDDLKGDNKNFSIKHPLGVQEIGFADGVRLAYSRYDGLRGAGVLTEPEELHDYALKLREAFNLHQS